MIIENQTGKTPNKILAQMQTARLGKIAFALQFIALAVMLLSVFSFIVFLAYIVVILVLAFFMLFRLYFSPIFESWWAAGLNIINFAVMTVKWWVYTAPVTLVLSAVSIGCLCADRKNKHTVKIVLSVIVAALTLGYIITNLIIMGASA